MATTKTIKKTKNRKQKKVELIPSVAYLRKSSKDETNAKGQQKRQSEKSISQQKKETIHLADGKHEIVADGWYADENTPGWKRGNKRPGFQAIMDRAKNKGDFQAILCDNLDRFSRANFDDVQEDARELKKAGVRWIVTAAQGTFDFGLKNDIGEILKFAVAVWSAHEYSRQLGRRILIAKRNKALEGKRSGSRAPYGMALNGQGLKPGKASEQKVIQQIFDWFVAGRSMNSIAAELNKQGIKTKSGRTWHVQHIREALKRAAYVGDFVWNADTSDGQFFTVNSDGEVVEKTPDVETAPIRHENQWKGIISRQTWNKAQKRMKTLKSSGGKPRGRYALAGILKCGKCGKSMHGVTPQNRSTVYRCCTPAQRGSGSCGTWQILESEILPYVVNSLIEELDGIENQELVSSPPTSLKPQQQRTAEIEARKTELETKIETASENLLFVTDRRNIPALEKRISEMRDELAQLQDVQVPNEGREQEKQQNKFRKWFKEFIGNAVEIPISKSKGTKLNKLFWDETGDACVRLTARRGHRGQELYLRINPAVLNAVLLSLGCEVSLRWKTKEITREDGSIRNRNTFLGGVFKLGQTTEKFNRHDLTRSSR